MHSIVYSVMVILIVFVISYWEEHLNPQGLVLLVELEAIWKGMHFLINS